MAGDSWRDLAENAEPNAPGQWGGAGWWGGVAGSKVRGTDGVRPGTKATAPLARSKSELKGQRGLDLLGGTES